MSEREKKDEELKIENIQQHHRHHLHETTLCSLCMESFLHTTEQFEAIAAANSAKDDGPWQMNIVDIEVIEI